MHLNCDMVRAAMHPARSFLLGSAFVFVACSDPDSSDGDIPEQITTVELTFSPDGGGPAVTAAFRDPDGDGGASGSSEPIMLAASTTYTLTLAFANELFDPPEDITAEVEAEAEAHQVFIHGDAVAGPATGVGDALLVHAYADVESDYGDNAVGDDLPVGLANTITTMDAGSGKLAVMLRHMPELNGQPQKASGAAERLASGEPLPGDVDADVEFTATVE
jgi:hypothetical protein